VPFASVPHPSHILPSGQIREVWVQRDAATSAKRNALQRPSNEARTARGRHSERSEESQHASPHQHLLSLFSHKQKTASQSEAHTTKGRHPERNEVKSKDLHSFQPSTPHKKPKPHRQPMNRVPQVREANLGHRAKRDATTQGCPAKLKRSKTVILTTVKNPNTLRRTNTFYPFQSQSQKPASQSEARTTQGRPLARGKRKRRARKLTSPFERIAI